jgi:hypothetical protein
MSTRFVHAGSLFDNDVLFGLVTRNGDEVANFDGGVDVTAVEQLDLMLGRGGFMVIPVTVTLADGTAFTVISPDLGAEVATADGRLALS